VNLVTLADIQTAAEAANGQIDRIYLHWSAGEYGQQFDDYHINIDKDGEIYVDGQLRDYKPHTWHRNTNAVGVALDCAYGAMTTMLGDYPPTQAQIETAARVIAVLCSGLTLPIDSAHVMTHAEIADIDGYGPETTCEKWDLWMLSDGQPQGSGGEILRGKAVYYQQNGLNA